MSDLTDPGIKPQTSHIVSGACNHYAWRNKSINIKIYCSEFIFSVNFRLKNEISEHETKIKKQEEAILDEQSRSQEHLRRWEQAENEVKELHDRLQIQADVRKL